MTKKTTKKSLTKKPKPKETHKISIKVIEENRLLAIYMAAEAILELAKALNQPCHTEISNCLFESMQTGIDIKTIPSEKKVII